MIHDSNIRYIIRYILILVIVNILNVTFYNDSKVISVVPTHAPTNNGIHILNDMLRSDIS